MEHGSQSMLTDNPLRDFVTHLMQISLSDGFHLEIRPVLNNTSATYVVRILTPSNPQWTYLYAAETPTLALSGASRIVGAMDRIP